MLVSLCAEDKFYYGLKFRPYSIGAQPTSPQPNQFIAAEDVRKYPQFAKVDKRDYRHGILAYPSKLSDKDVKGYELVDLNGIEDKKWDAFIELIKDCKEYDMTYDDFVEDYIHPRAELRDENPLKDLKPIEFFSMLEKKGFPGKLAGLKRLYKTTKV